MLPDADSHHPNATRTPTGASTLKFYCLQQGTSKRGEGREGSLRREETHARAGTLWHKGLVYMGTK